MQAKDYLIRAMLGENQGRLFVIDTTEVVRQAWEYHNTFPIATAALGRTLTIGLILGSMLKDDGTITIQIKGDGPLGSVVVSANGKGECKGYVQNPSVDLPLSETGKLAVGEGIGQGTLTVIRDVGLKEPYQGTVPLQTGEIGEDFAYYFVHSEQTPSAVSVGVLIDVDGSPLSSGGLLVQLMPGSFEDEEFISKLESILQNMPAASTLFQGAKTSEEIIADLFGELDPKIISKEPVAYLCDCSFERFEQALITLGVEELEDLIASNETIETVCHFCNKKYDFTHAKLKELVLNLKQ